MRCYIFDLDGTLCDISHRLHYIKRPAPPAQWTGDGVTADLIADAKAAGEWKADWDSFYAACVGDEPIEPMCQLVRHLARHCPIIFVSGRSDVVRLQTRSWLDQNLNIDWRNWRLFMRPDGDHRPDHELKAELLDQILAAGWQPIMCFDDRKQVVDMWRKRGLVCAQVAEGDF